MKFCIIGLGNFGTQLSRQLGKDGHEIIGVDNDEDHVDALKDEIEFLLQADCTDINAFDEIPVAECDAVIVAIGEAFEASLSIAANAQQAGAKRLICRIINPLHARLLKLLGIAELLIPEAMAAAWLARSLRERDVLNSFPVGGGYEILEITIPPALVGKTLREVDMRAKHDLNLVTIIKRKRASSVSSSLPQVENVIGTPPPERVFEENDILLIFGSEKNLTKFMEGR